LIACSEAVTRFGLVALLRGCRRFHVCAEAGTLAKARELAVQRQPALVLAGMTFPDGDGLDLLKDLRKLQPRPRTVVLTLTTDPLVARRAFRAGARGVVVMCDDRQQIITALDKAMAGELHVSASIWRCLLHEMAESDVKLTNPAISRLSNRELQILRRLGAGHCRSQVATELHVSAKTIDSHTEHIKVKLGLETIVQVTEKAASWMAEELPRLRRAVPSSSRQGMGSP
jgi:DNA-binding NarL/FixJ family response regulator